MKRLPTLFTLLALIALSASLAYWGLQLFKPQPRAQAAVAQQALPEPSAEAAGSLFGGHSTVVVSNYQLKGVVAAKPLRDSVAIIVADGKPAQALKVGHELAPGVLVKEVQPQFVMLSEGGVLKRIDLPPASKDGGAPQNVAAQPIAPPPPPPQQPMPMQQQVPPPPVVTPAPTLIVQPPTQ